MLHIKTISLALALCAGGAVTAGAQAASPATKSDTTVISGQPNRHQMRGGRTDRGYRSLFNGIDLSSAQRTRVDSIREKYQAEAKPLRDQMMPAMKEARAARESGDSAKLQAARRSMSEPRDKMVSLRKQEVAEIRGVLTPEQQATFDKNAKNARDQLRQQRGEHHHGNQGGSTKS
jgi:Spy/CpxP family protein refolding chaperone